MKSSTAFRTSIRVERLDQRRLLSAVAGLDDSFGANGVVSTSLPADIVFSAKVAQSDGKTVLCGYTHLYNGPTGRDFVVARINVDGTLDGTFGNGGVTITDIQPRGGVSQDEATALALQSDGDIIVVGRSVTQDYPYAGAVQTDAVAARYTTDGRIDASFGQGDRAAGSTAAYVLLSCTSPQASVFSYNVLNAVAVQADGEIIVAGSAGYASDNNNYALEFLEPDGSLDLSHDGGTGHSNPGTDVLGFYNEQLHEDHEFRALNFLPDGRLLAMGPANGGKAQSDAAQFGLAIVGTDGKVNITGDYDFLVPRGSVGAEFTSFAVMADGRVVAAGVSGTGTSAATARTMIFAERFVADGKLGFGVPDKTFGKAGIATVAFPADPAVIGTDVAVAVDGKVTIAAQVSPTVDQAALTQVSPAAVRLTAAGKLDITFGLKGIVLPGFAASGIGVDDDVAGTSSPERELLSLDSQDRATVYSAANGQLQLFRTTPDVVDLAAGPLVARSVAHAGKRAAGVSINITEAGTQLARGTATVQLIATPADGSAPVVATAAVKFNLSAGRSKVFRLNFKWPKPLLRGAYQLSARLIPAASLNDAVSADDYAAAVALQSV